MSSTRLKLLPAKWAFILFLLVLVTTSCLVFVAGLEFHRSLFLNSIITLTVLSACFLVFVSVGLFFGVRLKEDVGDLTSRIKWTGSGDGIEVAGESVSGLSFEMGEGLVGILLGILWWLCATFLFVALLFFFETIIWAILMIFLAMLYWIFYRALKLVFRHSGACKGRIGKSLAFGITYTALYTAWFFLIFYLLEILV